MNDFLSYFGAATGLFGAVVSWVSFRRTGNFKSLELRLELGKSASELEVAVDALPQLLDHAKRSREALSAAMGMNRSGAHAIWMETLNADYARIGAIRADMPDHSRAFAKLSHGDLEARMVSIHALRTKAAQLQEKYEACIAEDDKDREHIRKVAPGILSGR